MRDRKSLKVFVLTQSTSLGTTCISDAVERKGHDLTLVKYFEDGQRSAIITDSGLIADKSNIYTPFEYDCAMLRCWGTAHRGMEFLNLFEKAGVTVLSPTKYTKITDSKVHSARLFSDEGLSFPKTVVCNGTDRDLERVFEIAKADLGDPEVMVYKPDYATQGIGIHFVSNPDDLRNAITTTLEAIHQQVSLDYILQEFVGDPNEPIKHYRVVTYGDKCIPQALELSAASPLVPSNSCKGADVRAVDLDQDIADLAIESAKVSKLAFSGVDIMRRIDGQPVLLEVNDSPAVHTMDNFGHDASGKCVDTLAQLYEQQNLEIE